MIRTLAIASLFVFASAPLWAADCKVEVDSTDQMTFSTNAFEVSKSCKTFTVKLTHSGVLPKSVMGHNWVLTRETDMRGVVDDGMSAGVDHDYLKPGDERVIAHTKIIGAGETDSVTFQTDRLDGGDLVFFCSFPGHAAMMKGSVKLVE